MEVVEIGFDDATTNRRWGIWWKFKCFLSGNSANAIDWATAWQQCYMYMVSINFLFPNVRFDYDYIPYSYAQNTLMANTFFLEENELEPTDMRSRNSTSFAKKKKKRKSVALDLVALCCDWMDVCIVRVIYFIQHNFYVPRSDFSTFSIVNIPFSLTGLRRCVWMWAVSLQNVAYLHYIHCMCNV